MPPVWVTVLVMSMLPWLHGLDIRIGYTAAKNFFAGAAISMGLDRIQDEGYLTEHNFTIIHRINPCSPLLGVAAEIELVEDETVDVIMGILCSSVCIPAGYYDTYYNIARFPTGCSDPKLTNKADYPTLVRSMPDIEMVGRAFVPIFRTYGWTRVAMMVRDADVCGFADRGIADSFEGTNVTVTDRIRLSDDVTDASIVDGLLNMRERARVIIICHHWAVMRRIMYAAQRLEMVAAEYTYFCFNLLPSAETSRPWEEPARNLTSQQTASNKQAFASFKQVTLASFTVEKYAEFARDLTARFAVQPWNWTGPFTTNPYMMYLTDAAYLYFTILHEMIEAGENYRDGKMVFERARNRIFYGWTGRVVMNNNADNEGDFWVWDCHIENDQCQPYAYLTIAPTQNISEMRTPFWGTKDGNSPPDSPACGFKEELCPSDNNFTVKAIGSVVSVLVVLLVVLVMGFHVRQQRREKQLQMMTWKVNSKDIEFRKVVGSCTVSMRSMKSLASKAISSESLTSGMKAANEQLFAKVGNYNGLLVAVKRIHKPSINLTREVLVELKMMKDIVHENINPFIGACVEAPNICILSAYCPKGSLHDIIENGDIKLDWMFKSSLIRDLLNGMAYLHNSPLRSHGRLRSTNCLIDSRWVLKVAGFGLARFEERGTKHVSKYKKYEKLVWTSPELLRMPNQDRSLYGTNKGDVYSFAIILQELIYRSRPFFEALTHRDIVAKVSEVGDVPYRPAQDPSAKPEIMHLMARCWQEEPNLRPSFDEIRKIFKTINKGANANILDNMISMLEKYANNLEGLVQQRTGELLDEKKKTDLLLHRMLPPSVADLLKVGKVVDPEMYESVTIYFSDIVGFTSLSSSSTPMEVVDLLNDLYTAFDRTIEKYDVYKVETIGDAYMVVSGLPERNDSRHAPEIADMALALLQCVLTFRIRHRPDKILNLRIGLHTGPCAAGVVGQTMPRYCLFGDTVNMASRMESTGEAQKIHISESTKNFLSQYQRYHCQSRGTTEVKGKGKLTTYWLFPNEAVAGSSPEPRHADGITTPGLAEVSAEDSMTSL